MAEKKGRYIKTYSHVKQIKNYWLSAHGNDITKEKLNEYTKNFRAISNDNILLWVVDNKYTSFESKLEIVCDMEDKEIMGILEVNGLIKYKEKEFRVSFFKEGNYNIYNFILLYKTPEREPFNGHKDIFFDFTESLEGEEKQKFIEYNTPLKLERKNNVLGGIDVKNELVKILEDRLNLILEINTMKKDFISKNRQLLVMEKNKK